MPITGAGAVAGRFFQLSPSKPIYRHYNNRIGTSPRTATVQGIAGDVITLTAAEAYRFWTIPGESDDPEGNCYLYIKNTTRTEYAWVKACAAANTLTVTDAADIAAWVLNNTISTAVMVPTTAVLLDISPIVPIGAVAVAVKSNVNDNTGIGSFGTGASIDASGGSWQWNRNQVINVDRLVYPIWFIDSANSYVYLKDLADNVAPPPFAESLATLITVMGYIK